MPCDKIVPSLVDKDTNGNMLAICGLTQDAIVRVGFASIWPRASVFNLRDCIDSGSIRIVF